VDMLSIVRKHHLPTDFPGAVQHEAAHISEAIHESELARREDLRHQMIVIDVSDSGAPAPLTELDRLLQGPNKDGRGPGAGLGLYVAKAMAEAVGGAVKALNLPSRGLTLLVELPLDLPERVTRSI